MSQHSTGLKVALLPASAQDRPAAEALAAELGLELLCPGADPPDCDGVDAVLTVSGDKLSLQQVCVANPSGRGLPGPVCVDFGSAAMRHRRRSGHNELVGRAVGAAKMPGLRLLDATAGLGRDAFVLADLGCRVELCERNAIIAAMLGWSLQAAADSGDPWLAGVVHRMTLYPLDARHLAADVLQPIDVIYLDPMFPQRENSAAVKKEMALFQLLLDSGGGQLEAAELLAWALQQDVARVVVKRPPRAPCLEGCPPSHRLSGKAVRYDVYVMHGLN